MKVHLEADFVEAVKTPKRYYDGTGGNGLSLLVRFTAKGTLSKSWEQRLKGPDGKWTGKGLGGYPAVSLEEARTKAMRRKIVADALAAGFEKVKKQPGQAHHVKVVNGITRITGMTDSMPAELVAPVAPPSAAGPTFQSVAEYYLGYQSGSWKASSKTLPQARFMLREYVFPVLGNKPIAQVQARDVMDVLSPLWHSKQATAKKVMRYVRAVLHHALGQDLIETDPTVRALIGLGRLKIKPKHFGAVPWSETPKAYKALQACRSYAGKKQALAFLMLTATRTSEVRGATWEEIDWDKQLWTIPVSRTKTGIEHLVPLSSVAVQWLRKALKKSTGSGLVFTDRKGGMISQDGIRQLIKRRYPQATTHGFRSSFRDWVADETDYPGEIAEHALGHLAGEATMLAYRRTNYLLKRAALMQLWADFLAP